MTPRESELLERYLSGKRRKSLLEIIVPILIAEAAVVIAIYAVVIAVWG